MSAKEDGNGKLDDVVRDDKNSMTRLRLLRRLETYMQQRHRQTDLSKSETVGNPLWKSICEIKNAWKTFSRACGWEVDL